MNQKLVSYSEHMTWNRTKNMKLSQELLYKIETVLHSNSKKKPNDTKHLF